MTAAESLGQRKGHSLMSGASAGTGLDLTPFCKYDD
jgi:hypothetical protein